MTPPDPAAAAALAVVLGYLADAAWGEPPAALHPTVWIGRAAARLEALLRPRCRSPRTRYLGGAVAAPALVGAAGAAGWALATAASRLHPWGGAAAAGLAVFAAVARRGLGRAAFAVHAPLAAGRLDEARRRLAEIVGRDTDGLDSPQVVRGAVETVAENASDAVVAPLFYACLGGALLGPPLAAALALAHRAANTLDALWGYRNERFLHFGWAAARLDDLFNYLPARITAACLCLAAPAAGLDARRAWRTLRRDGRRHPSPNAGLPEAAAAGALGVRLGGASRYGGRVSPRPHLGDPLRPLSPDRIPEAVRLMNLASHLALIAGLAALIARR